MSAFSSQTTRDGAASEPTPSPRRAASVRGAAGSLGQRASHAPTTPPTHRTRGDEATRPTDPGPARVPANLAALTRALWIRETLRLAAVPDHALRLSTDTPWAACRTSAMAGQPTSASPPPAVAGLPWQPVPAAARAESGVETPALPSVDDTAPRWTVWVGVAAREDYEALIADALVRFGVEPPDPLGDRAAARDGTTSTEEVWGARLDVDSLGRPIPGSVDVAPVWLWLAGHTPGETLRQAHLALCRRLDQQLQSGRLPDTSGSETAGDVPAPGPAADDRTASGVPMPAAGATPIPRADSARAPEPLTLETLTTLCEAIALGPAPDATTVTSHAVGAVPRLGAPTPADVQADASSRRRTSIAFRVAVADWSPATARRGFDERLREVHLLAEAVSQRDAPGASDRTSASGPRGVRACLLRAPIVQRLIERPAPSLDGGAATGSEAEPSAPDVPPGGAVPRQGSRWVARPGTLYHAAATRLSLLPGGWRPLDQLVERQRRKLAVALALCSDPRRAHQDDARTGLVECPEQLFSGVQDWNGWPVHPANAAHWPRPPLLFITDRPEALRDTLLTLADCPQLASPDRIAIADVPASNAATSAGASGDSAGLVVTDRRPVTGAPHTRTVRAAEPPLPVDGARRTDDGRAPTDTSAALARTGLDDVPLPDVALVDAAPSAGPGDPHTDNPPARLRRWIAARDALFVGTDAAPRPSRPAATGPAPASDAAPCGTHDGAPDAAGSMSNPAEHDDPRTAPTDPLSEPLRNAFDTIAIENPELEAFARGVAYRLAPVEQSLQRARRAVSRLEQRLARQSQRWDRRLQRLRDRLVEVETDIRRLDIECQDIAERLAEVQHKKRPQWMGRLARAVGLRSRTYQDWLETCDILREQLAATNDRIRAIEPLERRLQRLIGRCQSRRHRERVALENAFVAAGETLAREQTRFRALIERQKERFEAWRSGNRSVLPKAWPPRDAAANAPLDLPEIGDIWDDASTPAEDAAASMGPPPEAVRAILAQLGFPQTQSDDEGGLFESTVVLTAPSATSPNGASATVGAFEPPPRADGQGRPVAPDGSSAAHASRPHPSRSSGRDPGDFPSRAVADTFLALTIAAVEPLQRLNLRALEAHLRDPHHHPLTPEQRRTLWKGLSLDRPIVIASNAFARRHLIDLGERFFEHVVIDAAETRSPAEISLFAALGVSVSLRFSGRDHLRWADVSRWSDALLGAPPAPSPVPSNGERRGPSSGPSNGPSNGSGTAGRAAATDAGATGEPTPRLSRAPGAAPPQRLWIDSTHPPEPSSSIADITSTLGPQTPSEDIQTAVAVVQRLHPALPHESTLWLTAPLKGTRDALARIADRLHTSSPQPHPAIDGSPDARATGGCRVAVATPAEIRDQLAAAEHPQRVAVVVVLGTARGDAGDGSRRWAAAGDKRLRAAFSPGPHRLIVVGRRTDWASVLSDVASNIEVGALDAVSATPRVAGTGANGVATPRSSRTTATRFAQTKTPRHPAASGKTVALGRRRKRRR